MRATQSDKRATSRQDTPLSGAECHERLERLTVLVEQLSAEVDRLSRLVANATRSRKLVPGRRTLAQTLAALGICRTTFYRHWRDTFTPFQIDGGHLRFCTQEVAEAVKHTDPVRARAAVRALRHRLGRVQPVSNSRSG